MSEARERGRPHPDAHRETALELRAHQEEASRVRDDVEAGVEQAVDRDYPVTPVPRHARKSFFSLAVVLLGFTVFTPTMLAGAALAGFDRRLQPSAPVALLDGMACGVRMAETMVALRLPKPHTGSFAAPAGRASIGLSPALDGILRGQT